MNCIKCGVELPEGSVYCYLCGKKQLREKKKKARGNGQGSVFRLPSGKYKAVVTIGYIMSNDGKRRRKTHSQVFATKKEAIAALPRLLNEPVKKQKRTITFKELYEKWLPTHRAGKSTMDCYKAAFKRPLVQIQSLGPDKNPQSLENTGLCGFLHYCDKNLKNRKKQKKIALLLLLLLLAK